MDSSATFCLIYNDILKVLLLPFLHMATAAMFEKQFTVYNQMNINYRSVMGCKYWSPALQ